MEELGWDIHRLGDLGRLGALLLVGREVDQGTDAVVGPAGRDNFHLRESYRNPVDEQSRMRMI